MSSDLVQGEPFIQLPTLFVITVNPEIHMVIIREATAPPLFTIPINLLVEFIQIPIKAFDFLQPLLGNLGRRMPIVVLLQTRRYPQSQRLACFGS